MKIVEAESKELEGLLATHGFRILDNNENVVAFFHWHEDGQVMVPLVERTGEGEDEIKITETPEFRTQYTDVLAAIPQRLEEMGLKKEVKPIMDEIKGMYGKKAKKR